MSRKSPKHARPVVRRGVVAATAVAATAAMTLTAPGAAGAATTPTGNPQIDAILAAAPALPGTVTAAGIVAVSPQIDKLIEQYKKISGLSGLIPITNQAGAIVAVPPFLPYANAPGWGGMGADNTVTVGAPLGLGSLTNVTYGIIGGNAAGLGSIGGNATTVTTPLGAFGVNNSLAITTKAGLTTITPTLGGGYTAPMGLGSTSASLVPVTVTYGDKTFLVGLPAVNLGLTIPGVVNANVGLNLGQIGMKDGKLVMQTPSLTSSLSNALLGTGGFTVTPGIVTAGTGGLDVTTPGVVGKLDTPILDVNTKVDPGTAHVGTDGATLTTPKAHVGADTPLGGGSADYSGGDFGVTDKGKATIDPGDAKSEVHSADGTMKVDANVDAGKLVVDPTKPEVAAEAPEAGAHVKTPEGTHGVEVDGGSGKLDTSGPSVTEKPDVSIN